MKFKFIRELIKADMMAKDSSDVIYQLGELLSKHGFVSGGYADKVIEREIEYPTGLQTRGPAIAIPHACDDGINGNHVAIGILKEPVKFQNMEDLDEEVEVKLVFMLAISSSHDQLEMLQFLIKVFQYEKLLNNIANTDSSEAICNYLNQYIEELENN